MNAAVKNFTVAISEDLYFEGRCVSTDLDRVLARRGYQSHVFVKIRRESGHLCIDAGVDSVSEYYVPDEKDSSLLRFPAYYETEFYDEIFERLSVIYAGIPEGAVTDHAPFESELDALHIWLEGVDAENPDFDSSDCYCSNGGCGGTDWS